MIQEIHQVFPQLNNKEDINTMKDVLLTLILLQSRCIERITTNLVRSFQSQNFCNQDKGLQLLEEQLSLATKRVQELKLLYTK